ncbi:MAG: siroheme synthase CysG [Pseudomonadota bacterium]
MDYFPAFLDLDGKPCLVVGGGEIAARKVRLLLAARARLTIVAPETCDAITALAHDGKLEHLRKSYAPDDLNGRWLVVSATGSEKVEAQVYADATARRIFCNAVDRQDNCSYITPAIVDRSPVLVAISSGGAAPVLARRIRARLEAILPARLGVLAALARRYRQRVLDALPALSPRIRFWERVIDGPAGVAALAGDVAAAEASVESLLGEAAALAAEPGIAWLTGAGPGDPELLTLRALQALQSADVIVHDRLVSEEILALARRDAERISVGKTPGCRANSQASINELLVELVAAGKRVCRLKGGDPFIFGRGGEEAEALAAEGLRYRVIPGITAAAGCAAAAGIPLTHRDDAQSVVLLTAHGKDSIDTLDWPSLARDRQTLAIYMGVRRFTDLMTRLIEHGRPADTPIAIVERGTIPEQRVIRGTLGQLNLLAEAHRVVAPALLLIGAVASRGAGIGAQNVTEASAAPGGESFAQSNRAG